MPLSSLLLMAYVGFLFHDLVPHHHQSGQAYAPIAIGYPFSKETAVSQTPGQSKDILSSSKTQNCLGSPEDHSGLHHHDFFYRAEESVRWLPKVDDHHAFELCEVSKKASNLFENRRWFNTRKPLPTQPYYLEQKGLRAPPQRVI